MAGSRGYHSYHGRAPKWKVILAVVLVLVIFAAVSVIVLQEYVVYDGTGTPHLKLPKENGPASEEDPVELTIESPAAPEVLRGVSIGEKPLTLRGIETVLGESNRYNAAAVTMKDASGTVYFDTAAAVSGSVVLAADTTAALRKLTEIPEKYIVARMSCFRDSKAANHSVEEMGLKNTGGFIFYDGRNEQWLDPAKPAVRQYLCSMAKEIAALGFDEVLLTDVSYPTEGKLDKIDYGDGEKAAHLAAFLDEVRAALEPYDVTVSVEVPEAVIAGETGGDIPLAELAARVDRIYAQTLPSRVDALRAAMGETEFIPELSTQSNGAVGSYLLLKPS